MVSMHLVLDEAWIHMVICLCSYLLVEQQLEYSLSHLRYFAGSGVCVHS